MGGRAEHGQYPLDGIYIHLYYQKSSPSVHKLNYKPAGLLMGGRAELGQYPIDGIHTFILSKSTT